MHCLFRFYLVNPILLLYYNKLSEHYFEPFQPQQVKLDTCTTVGIFKNILQQGILTFPVGQLVGWLEELKIMPPNCSDFTLGGAKTRSRIKSKID